VCTTGAGAASSASGGGGGAAAVAQDTTDEVGDERRRPLGGSPTMVTLPLPMLLTLTVTLWPLLTRPWLAPASVLPVAALSSLPAPRRWLETVTGAAPSVKEVTGSSEAGGNVAANIAEAGLESSRMPCPGVVATHADVGRDIGCDRSG
jgi:hypothetical protein